MDAPLPGQDPKKAAKNYSSELYHSYLLEQRKVTSYLTERKCFAEWARENTVIKKSNESYEPKRRGGHGVGKNKSKCALAIRFPWEMLDNFIPFAV